jgi:hypothetical protein
LCCVCLVACSGNKGSNLNTTKGFYYWKSTVKQGDASFQRLDSLKAAVLYVKFFDIVWEKHTNTFKPVSVLRDNHTLLSNLHIQVIPVIYITNEAMHQMHPEMIDSIAEKITKLTQHILEVNHIQQPLQLQFDCDWSAATGERYFSLLQQIRKLNPNVLLSATIRLHQMKHFTQTGVPPVDRGLLMCYNMGNLKDIRTKNSILDPELVRQYTSGNSVAYPLKLDYAFPLFNWTVLFRQNNYAGLLRAFPEKQLTVFRKIQKSNRYQVEKDTVLSGYRFKKGDLLRFENSYVADILKSASYLKSINREDSFSVVLYHLDSAILNNYTSNELENIFNCMY